MFLMPTVWALLIEMVREPASVYRFGADGFASKKIMISAVISHIGHIANRRLVWRDIHLQLISSFNQTIESVILWNAYCE